MKRILILIVLSIFMLCGCTSPVKKDLAKYINNDIVKALEIQESSVIQYEKFISVESYSFDELSAMLNNFIPTYKKLVNELDSIKPNTKEVQEIHNTYVKGVNKQLEALHIIKKGSETKNKEMINKGNEIMKDANSYLERFKKEILELSDKYGIKYIK